MKLKLTAILALSGSLLCCNAIDASARVSSSYFNAENNLLLNKTIFSQNSIALNSDFQNEEEKTKFVLFISDGILNIECKKPEELVNADIIIYNLLGQKMTQKKLEMDKLNKITLPLQNTCFIVKILYLGNIFTQKIIVKE